MSNASKGSQVSRKVMFFTVPREYNIPKQIDNEKDPQPQEDNPVDEGEAGE